MWNKVENNMLDKEKRSMFDNVKRYVFVKRAVYIGLLALVLVAAMPADRAAVAAGAAGAPKPVDNLGDSRIKSNYMVSTDSGYMRVACDGEDIYTEYYDNNYKLTSSRSIEMELPMWGGFYKGDNAYYIVEGNENANCVDNTEVVRIIKYDTSWNRLGAGSILAKEGWEYEIRYPFDYGCVSMTEAGGKLYVTTGREGYVDPKYGQGHQGMMLIRMGQLPTT